MRSSFNQGLRKTVKSSLWNTAAESFPSGSWIKCELQY